MAPIIGLVIGLGTIYIPGFNMLSCVYVASLFDSNVVVFAVASSLVMTTTQEITSPEASGSFAINADNALPVSLSTVLTHKLFGAAAGAIIANLVEPGSSVILSVILGCAIIIRSGKLSSFGWLPVLAGTQILLVWLGIPTPALIQAVYVIPGLITNLNTDPSNQLNQRPLLGNPVLVNTYGGIAGAISLTTPGLSPLAFTSNTGGSYVANAAADYASAILLRGKTVLGEEIQYPDGVFYIALALVFIAAFAITWSLGRNTPSFKPLSALPIAVITLMLNATWLSPVVLIFGLWASSNRFKRLCFLGPIIG